MSTAYPMMVDVTQRLVVIVGGGKVAVRKVRGLMDAGAKRVRVVSLEFYEEMPEAVERVTKPFAPEDLEGASLVFAATDSHAVNEAVVHEARRRGIWVNRADADEDQPGDFSTPAVWRGGALTVTVATLGAPALAAKIRDELVKSIDGDWVAMAGAMRIIRPAVLGAVHNAQSRREIFKDLTSNEAIDVLGEQGFSGLWRWLAERHAQMESVPQPP